LPPQTEQQSVEQSVVPDSVNELVTWLGRIEASYVHIGRTQAFIRSMLSEHRPFTITWKYPIITDLSQLDVIASDLQLDEAHKSRLARHYYGMQM